MKLYPILCQHETESSDRVCWTDKKQQAKTTQIPLKDLTACCSWGISHGRLCPGRDLKVNRGKRELCKEKWKSDLPELSDEDIEYASVFIFNGALGVVNFWVKNDFDKDIDEISNIIESISYYGTRRFIYKK